MDKPLSLHELAEEVRLPAAWLKAEALAGRLPCLRVGRRLLFNLGAVEAALLDRARLAFATDRPQGEGVPA